MAASTAPTPTIESNLQSISSSNRGPLTNLWVLPASCTATVSYRIEPAIGTAGQLFFAHYGTVFDSNCYPTGAGGVRLSKDSDWASFYYSPAICPSEWIAVARFSFLLEVSPAQNYLSLGPETTAALCCPFGYSYVSGSGHQCFSTVSAGHSLEFYSYTYKSDSWEKGSPLAIPWLSSANVYGDGIPILWQQSDLAVLSRASTITMNPRATTASTSSPTPSISPTSTTTTEKKIPSPNGLSTGAKIGLGVSIPVAIIALLALCFLLWSRRRKRKAVDTNNPLYEVNSQMTNKDVPPVPGSSTRGYVTEIDGVEMEMRPQFQAMQTSPEEYHHRQELSGVAYR